MTHMTGFTWFSSAGLFLICWAFFLEVELFLLSKKWQSQFQRLWTIVGRKTFNLKIEFTYEGPSFLVLILRINTVIVMPISTPAASNRAMTLMTSLVAIWGRGFSTKARQEQQNNHESADRIKIPSQTADQTYLWCWLQQNPIAFRCC